MTVTARPQTQLLECKLFILQENIKRQGGNDVTSKFQKIPAKDQKMCQCHLPFHIHVLKTTVTEKMFKETDYKSYHKCLF